MKTIAIGSDHAGFELKEKLKKYLAEKDYAVFDCGVFDSQPADYPVSAHKVARLISDKAYGYGIIIDGAGIGSAMVANKIPHVRAALCYDLSTAKNSREHNDANVLTLGAGFVGYELAKQIVDIWLTSECTIERHQRRVKMIDEIEKDYLASDSPKISNLKAALLSDTDIERIASHIGVLMKQEAVSKAADSSAHCDKLICDSCGQCADKAPDVVRQVLHVGASRVSNAPGGGRVPEDIAKFIDHTLLKPDASADDIKKLCEEAIQYHFATVCINPTYVRLASECLHASEVNVCTVVGFPLGAHVPEVKGLETRRAIRDGAREIDMVINIGALKSGDDALVLRDIRTVVDACLDSRVICKVIIEAALLNDDEKIRACELSKTARAHYVKTSTGFGPGGATVHDIQLMSRTVSGTKIGVKAAGGIKNYQDAQKMIEAGATRIGASAGVKIVKEARQISKSE